MSELKCEKIKDEYVIRRYKSDYRHKTVWMDKEYNSNVHGSTILNNIIGEKRFSFPKSVFTVKDSIDATTKGVKGEIILIFLLAQVRLGTL